MAQIFAVGMDAINPNLALPLTRDRGKRFNGHAPRKPFESLNKSHPRCQGVEKKPLSRLELETSPLPRECSTAELQGHVADGPGWI